MLSFSPSDNLEFKKTKQIIYKFKLVGLYSPDGPLFKQKCLRRTRLLSYKIAFEFNKKSDLFFYKKMSICTIRLEQKFKIDIK